MSARLDTLARLRGTIDRLDTGIASDAHHAALGHAEVDAALGGGLMQGALHEVFAEGRHGATATGFVAGLARRLSESKFLLWVRQDFSARETGDLSMSGFAELGLDPRRIVVVRAADAESALRVAADGLACNALGSVIAEIWGETQAFDLVASRKLTLAASQSGVTVLMLRIAAMPAVSTAETRWIVRTAHSSPAVEAWGAPVIDATLARNRHGPIGQWILEWKCDESRFCEFQAHSQPVAAAPADRPHQAADVAPRRATHASLDRRRQAQQRAAHLRAG